VTLPPRDAPLRVLVDHFHDSGWREARRKLAGGPFRATICRQRLTSELLERYHVAIVDGFAPTQFDPAELDAIERFVAGGGGLLLASSAPWFELIADAPASELPANAIATRLGFRFLAPEECAAATCPDREFRRGYRPEDATLLDDVLEGFGPQRPGICTWAPLATPDGARPLLAHRDSGEPLAALATYGDGRVCVFGSLCDHLNLLAHTEPLLRWLAAGAGERDGGAIEGEVGEPAVVCQQRRLRLLCDRPVAERASDVADLVWAADDFMRGIIGDRWETPMQIEVLQSAVFPDVWESDPVIGAAGADAALGYNVAFSLMLWKMRDMDTARTLVTLLPEYTLLRHLALRFIEHLGYEDEARRRRTMIRELLAEADPDRTACDLARMYWATLQWHPKGMWLLEELERAYGEDLLRRLFEIMPPRREDYELPRSYAWESDRAAWYLSRAAGEDLTPMLRGIGTTVHDFPLIDPDDEGLADALRARLVAGAMNGEASRRMEALTDLARLPDEERASLPEDARERVEAFRRSSASDAGATERLQTLMAGEDDAEAAWAALQALSAGVEDAADRLVELAPRQDVRFRLMAGHLLSKHGVDAPDLSLPGVNRDGERIGELDVKITDTLEVHPVVEGYRVANVICESGLAGFPHGNFARRLYVDWVHTSPQWRRSGLSRLAFEAAMQHDEAMRCSCFALNTGTRNNAHALYAEFGYVDMDQRERASKRLSIGTPCSPPDTVTIRPMADGDRDAVRRLLIDYHEGAFTISPLPVPELGEGSRASLAEREGNLIGVALATTGPDEHARIIDVAVDRQADNRPEIGLALVARLHQLLADSGAQSARCDLSTDAHLLRDVLSRAGYSITSTGDVNMFGIRDLTALLSEIRPLYERRLTDTPFAEWRGRIMVLGRRLRAGLAIEAGVVRVMDADPRPTDVSLHTDDETITRFVTGRETPLEGYLQRRTEISPQVSPSVMALLKTLFPKVPFIVRWGW